MSARLRKATKGEHVERSAAEQVVLSCYSRTACLELPHSSSNTLPALPISCASNLSQDRLAAQVAADGGPHGDLRTLFATLHRQGYKGVECSVRVAAALNAPAGEFAGLLNVRACNSSTFSICPQHSSLCWAHP